MKYVPMTPALLEVERKLIHGGCMNRARSCEMAQSIAADIAFWRDRYDAAIKLAFQLETELRAYRPRADAPRET